MESAVTFDNCNLWLIVWLCGSLNESYTCPQLSTILTPTWSAKIHITINSCSYITAIIWATMIRYRCEDVQISLELYMACLRIDDRPGLLQLTSRPWRLSATMLTSISGGWLRLCWWSWLPKLVVYVLLASAGGCYVLALAVCPSPLPCYCIGSQVCTAEVQTRSIRRSDSTVTGIILSMFFIIIIIVIVIIILIIILSSTFYVMRHRSLHVLQEAQYKWLFTLTFTCVKPGAVARFLTVSWGVVSLLRRFTAKIAFW